MTNLSALVIAGDPAIGALLFAMLETEGCDPLFPHDDERPLQALERLAPHLVITDCDHPAASTDEFFSRAEACGSAVILFSPSRDRQHMARVSRERGLRWFTLPIGRAELARILTETLLETLAEVALSGANESRAPREVARTTWRPGRGTDSHSRI